MALHIKNTLNRCAGIALLSGAACAYSQTPPVPMAETEDLFTFSVKGSAPKTSDNGTSSFELDARRFSFSDWGKLKTLPRLAIIFEGKVNENHECPVVDLTSRNYIIREVEPLIYKVEVKTTPSEIERVRSAGCAIVKGHSLKKVQPLNQHHGG